MSNLIQILDGKKTAIGWALLVLAECVELFFTKSGIAPPGWTEGAIGVMQYLGYAFGGVGIAHKGAKGDLTLAKKK